MDELINELLDRHNGDTKSCIAWCIGYIDRLERRENEIREVIGCVKETRLIDDLSEGT